MARRQGLNTSFHPTGYGPQPLDCIATLFWGGCIRTEERAEALGRLQRRATPWLTIEVQNRKVQTENPQAQFAHGLVLLN